mmetsp:Transcript_31751/g.100910  ORF Transcript_31751/g.100910 Transcript_31751/m.100910 type:complete len:231 (+) Transcript_31751:2406-3098(+)
MKSQFDASAIADMPSPLSPPPCSAPPPTNACSFDTLRQPPAAPLPAGCSSAAARRGRLSLPVVAAAGAASLAASKMGLLAPDDRSSEASSWCSWPYRACVADGGVGGVDRKPRVISTAEASARKQVAQSIPCRSCSSRTTVVMKRPTAAPNWFAMTATPDADARSATPNHFAASTGGTPRMKFCAMEHVVCPSTSSVRLRFAPAMARMSAPAACSVDPAISERRRPYFSR